MKSTKLFQLRLLLVLNASVILILVSGYMMLQACNDYENILRQSLSFQQYQKPLNGIALQLAFFAFLVIIGIVSILLTLMLLAGKRRREIAALQEKNQTMDELIHKQQQLAHHQRLEIIGTMTSSIAHEFNNLLTPIMGYSMMALEQISDENNELYDDILEIYDASRKAKTIISRLSDLSRKNTSETFRQVSLDALIQKTLEVVTPAKPRNSEIKLALNCWDQQIQANEIQISQLLLNLIINSFHAMENRDGILSIETWFDQDSVHVRISDNGCGIPQDVLPHIFQPFYTTKESGKGTGLGLAIVAQVIEDHHGQIHVDSVLGQGTSFTVSLPRIAEPPREQI